MAGPITLMRGFVINQKLENCDAFLSWHFRGGNSVPWQLNYIPILIMKVMKRWINFRLQTCVPIIESCSVEIWSENVNSLLHDHIHIIMIEVMWYLQPFYSKRASFLRHCPFVTILSSSTSHRRKTSPCPWHDAHRPWRDPHVCASCMKAERGM